MCHSLWPTLPLENRGCKRHLQIINKGSGLCTSIPRKMSCKMIVSPSNKTIINSNKNSFTWSSICTSTSLWRGQPSSALAGSALCWCCQLGEQPAPAAGAGLGCGLLATRKWENWLLSREEVFFRELINSTTGKISGCSVQAELVDFMPVHILLVLLSPPAYITEFSCYYSACKAKPTFPSSSWTDFAKMTTTNIIAMSPKSFECWVYHPCNVQLIFHKVQCMPK